MSADLQPLMSHHEAWFRVGEGAASDPAVIINPAASVHALVAAIQSRVDLLNTALGYWVCEDDPSTTADQLAESLHPHAEEASALLNALGQKLRGAAQTIAPASGPLVGTATTAATAGGPQ